MHFSIHLLTLTICSSFTSSAQAGPYDATPLRAPLAPEPHLQTSQGRKNHRFASAEINKYRLYDFYARQAKYNIEQKKFNPLLLPYPGLEGGRRGHWGGTNEKSTSAILDRTTEPKYVRLVDRGDKGSKHIMVEHGDKQSLCLFQNGSTSMTKITLNAKVHTPEFAFAINVDRFGFGLNFKGQDYLVGTPHEWYELNGKAQKVQNLGYYLHQDKVIFKNIIGKGNKKAALLDMPSVSYNGEIATYHRKLEWRTKSRSLKFPLPVEAQLIQQGKVEIFKKNDTWFATVTGSKRKLTHQIKTNQGCKNIKLKVAGGKIWVTFPAYNKGTCIHMASWIESSNSATNTSMAASVYKPTTLSQYLNGGPTYFNKTVSVQGKRNADPAAAGTAYEIDDIPVPVKNPYGMPMTLSGLAFEKNGTAYVSTLVGDIWKITNIDEKLKNITWKRYASGLNSPLGLEMVKGKLHVVTQHQILKLEDLNQDGEADFIQPITQHPFPHGRVHDLSCDAKGNFYFNNVKGIYKVSPDGTKMEIISHGARNPLGSGVRADGLALSDSSEGNNGNGTCTIYEAKHPENEKTVAKQRRLLYLPRGVDNSPGSRIFMNSEKFGPLGKSLLGVSFGSGRIYQILRDPNNGSPQAALHLLPGEFSSGSCRVETNPKDGQLYIAGLDGWGDFGVTEGCLHRIRYTGKKLLTPTAWKAYSNGISITFNQAIDPKTIDPKKLFVQQWNYRDSAHTYGSAEYSVKNPEKLGHDRLQIQSAKLSTDGKTLILNTPDILPAMCTQIYGNISSREGAKLELNLFATINKFSNKQIAGKKSSIKKSTTLKVPYHKKNGNTYAILTNFYDKRAGRDSFKRPKGPVIAWKKEELNYAWINKNIITAQTCIACHGPGTQHDISTYPKLMKTINLKHPDKSHLLGMIATDSMPPFPMPTVPEEMQKALKKWIELGAPK